MAFGAVGHTGRTPRDLRP